MEAVLIFVCSCAAVGALAVRFGCDSRLGASSPEESYSKLGLAWGNAHSNGDRRNGARSPGWTEVRLWLEQQKAKRHTFGGTHGSKPKLTSAETQRRPG